MKNVGAQYLVLSGLALSAACLGSSGARACVHSGNQTSIFFASVPQELASPVVAQVRILGVFTPVVDGSAYSGLARVEKVIRGTIKGDEIRLVSHAMSTCDRPFRIGEAGIVVGSISGIEFGLPVFAALTESVNQRLKREGATP